MLEKEQKNKKAKDSKKKKDDGPLIYYLFFASIKCWGENGRKKSQALTKVFEY